MQRYAITDRRVLAQTAALRSQVEQWTAGGVEWVQLREKDLPAAELAALTQELAAVVRTPGSRTRLLLNLGSAEGVGLSPKLALDCGAHGVHLPGALAEDVQAAREAGCLVSVACHALPELRAAREGGATLALWAPVFGKSVAGHQVAPGGGLPALAEACKEAAPLPVFALGGVTARNAGACLAAGAAGVAGIRLFQSVPGTPADVDWRSLPGSR